MSYYSEIGMVFTEECFNYFKQQLSLEEDIVQKEVNEFLEESDSKQEKDNCLLFYWNMIKFYPEYNYSQFITNFIDDLEEEYHKQLLFIYVGEDKEDNLEEGGFYNNPFELKLVRNVSFKEEIDE